MEALSQLDVTNPDHVSVITKDGRLTVSVTKDGTSVTMGFPVKTTWLNTSPRPPLQQPEPKLMAVKEPGNLLAQQVDKPVMIKKNRRSPIGNPKLTYGKVREIRQILDDGGFMKAFGSKQQAYEAIAAKYNVSYHTISNIHKGLAWREVSN